MTDDSESRHNADEGPPMASRPIGEQVAAVRHDADGLKLVYASLNEVVKRLTNRVENVEERQTLMEAQMAQDRLTPEVIKEMLVEVMTERAATVRAERLADMKNVLTRTQKLALWAVPFLMTVNFIGSWLGWW